MNNKMKSFNWSINSNCGDVNNLYDKFNQCNFTRTVLECLDNDDGFINYIQLTYCTIESKFLGIFVLLSILILLFFSIAINADDFLCPLLISISKSLKLSDNIAGVTFLAFGNGAPDIFSSIIGITNANPNLVIGQLYGAGIFVTTVVVGSILWQKPFEIMKRPLIRDILFYSLTTTLVWTIFLANKILLTHSIIFITIYLIYVFVVIISGYIYKRRQQQQNSLQSSAYKNAIEFHSGKMPRENLNRQTKYIVNHQHQNQNQNQNESTISLAKKIDAYEGLVLRRIKFRQYFQDPTQQRRLTLYHLYLDPLTQTNTNTTNIYSIPINDHNNNKLYDNDNIDIQNSQRRITISDDNFINSLYQQNNNDKKNKLFKTKMKKFFKKIYNNSSSNKIQDEKDNVSIIKKILAASRFDSLQFMELNFFAKIIMIIKAPIYLIYTITIPVVDNDLPKCGWIRQLNLWHLIISPQFCLFLFQVKIIDPYRLHLIVLVISFTLYIMVMFTSERNKAPRYHIFYAYFGFIVSISWIYAIANEVVNILDAIRVIFNISKFMIGLTIGAWGNSIGDFLSNLSMAKNGFPRMAISACFGGPVLNMLLGIGIPYTILFLRQQTHEIQIDFNKMITVLYATITVSLITTIIILLFITKFQSSRSHGFILFAIYTVFLIIAFITEFKLI